jgi:hypothetical protein
MSRGFGMLAPRLCTVEWEHQFMGDAQRQINHLREQVETLMRERGTPADTEVAGRADRAIKHYDCLSRAAVKQIAKNATHCRSDQQP